MRTDHGGRNFAHEPIPEHATIKAWHIGAIVVGGTIAVPGFFMAAEISGAAGFSTAALGFIIGCQVLGVLGVLTGIVGARSRLSTYLILRQAFGDKGFRVFTLITASVSLFWFGIIGNLFGEAMTRSLNIAVGLEAEKWIFSLLGGVGMTVIACYGIKTLDLMARIMVPIMAGLLLFGFYISLNTYDLEGLSSSSIATMSLGGAASAAIGAYSGGIVTLPDYMRYVRDWRMGAAAIYFALAISFPLILIITAVPATLAGTKDLISIFMTLGIGVGALLILIFSTVSSNCLMLYSSGLAISSWSERIRFWRVTAAFGFFATILSLFDVVSLFVPYISLLAISIPSLCGIYVCDFFLVHRGAYDADRLANPPDYNWKAFVAWAIGAGLGLASLKGFFSVTSVAALDSLFPAFVSYYLLSRFVGRRQSTEN